MPFKSTIRIPSEVLDAIVSLTEFTTNFAVEAATEAGRQDAYGNPALAEPRMAELAQGASVATGEVGRGTSAQRRVPRRPARRDPAMSGVRWGGGAR